MTIRTRGVLTAAVLLGALWAPASAMAAAPTVTTGRATQVTQSGAVLHGSIDPNGTATSWSFNFGPTRLYGSSTTGTPAGAGNKAKRVSFALKGLAPATTYHYRLVAFRGDRLWFGKDRTFKTKPQPLGVSLAATPNPIRIGGATTLAGTLTGTGNANRQVELLANPWPYTGGFQRVGNVQLTTSTGAFAFTLLDIQVNTQYRVRMPAKPKVISPIVVLGTTAKVTRHAKVVRRGSRRGTIRFYGRITPALDGAPVIIQKLRKRGWVNIARTSAHHTGKGYSRYSKKVRQRRGGRYRVVVADASGAHSFSVSKSIKRRHVRR